MHAIHLAKITPHRNNCGVARRLERLDATPAPANGLVAIYQAQVDRRDADVPTGKGTHAIAFDPQRKKGYVTNEDDDTVSVIDVVSQKLLKTVAVGQKPNGVVFRDVI